VPLLEHLDDELLGDADVCHLVDEQVLRRLHCHLVARVYPTFAFAQVLLRLLPGVSWFLELRHVPILQALSGSATLLT
jgi:hypothetical protein